MLLKHSGMAGDGFGDLLHQPAKLADFGGERIGGAARTHVTGAFTHEAAASFNLGLWKRVASQ